jgi:hypothetical protein
LQVEHQPGVVRVRGRHSDRPVQVRQRVVLDVALRLLDAPLDVPHTVQVLAHLGPVRRPQLPLQPANVVFDEVQEAGPAAQGRLPVRLVAPLAEEHFEHQPRMRLGRERRRGRRPRQVVLVDAGIPVIALADDLHHVHRQL